MVLSYMIHIKPLDNKDREIYIYIYIYIHAYIREYEIQYIIHEYVEARLVPILPYITLTMVCRV